ncbi:MAG: T9SS type A sorting domain-containing protein [Crocinitomicaceae bacterium]|nr:T9SS type A sorting domain-containing protein [Crocinitomicaceae bacterium]
MKKTATLLFFVFSTCSIAFAQYKISVADGNWSATSTWDCSCIPGAGDSIRVNHDVILDQDISGTIEILEILDPNASLLEDAPRTIENIKFFSNISDVDISYFTVDDPNGNFSNTGSISAQSIYLLDAAAVFNNGPLDLVDTLLNTVTNGFGSGASSVITADVIYTEKAFTISSGGSATATRVIGVHNPTMGMGGIINIYEGTLDCDDLLSGAHLNMSTDAFVTVSDSLVSDAGEITIGGSSSSITVGSYLGVINNLPGLFTVVNNGFVRVDGDFLLDADSFTWGNGQFCIGGQSENRGTVTGLGTMSNDQLDFCDVSSTTGGGFDINTGSVDLTKVVYCSASCGNLSVPESTKAEVRLFPNPANDVLHIESDSAINKVLLYQMNGWKISASNASTINVTTLPSGVYFVEVQTEQGNVVERFVKD